ncbi:MAG: Fic family protein [Phycisphaerales bacterium]
MFKPAFQITPAMTMALMAIEADRQAVASLPIDVTVLASLRASARLLSTHYSTRIEGNRLTEAQVEQALAGTRFPGRERDESEVRNYYAAVEHVEKLAAVNDPFTESNIQTLHGLVHEGRPAPTPYRDGQNVIRDSGSGAIVYLPPEAHDVPALMHALIHWIRVNVAGRSLPVPLIAACAHYQYATIHPYDDGNGRTARLLTTLILQHQAYGLKGIYSLEEYYARDLEGYYRALSLGPSHNYYMGRAETDITPFLAYFLGGMADAFSKVRIKAGDAAKRGAADHSSLLRELDPKQRRVLELFRRQGSATTAEIAKELGLSPRSARPLCAAWVHAGFLSVRDPSRRNRLFRLAPRWEAVVTS